MTDEERDALLEEVAMVLEESHIADFFGILARKKRAQEDAELYRKTRIEQRASLAGIVRAMKTGQGRDNRTFLCRLAERLDEQPDQPLVERLCDLWPLAEAGWIDIDLVVRLTSNVLQPQSEPRVQITAKGREVISQMALSDVAGSA